MKHTLQITLIITAIFFIAQVVGLSIIYGYLDQQSLQEGEILFKDLPWGVERMPELEQGDLAGAVGAITYILFAVLFGTGLIFLLMRFKRLNIWKLWYLIAVIVCLGFAIYTFIPLPMVVALVSIALGLWKVFRPNIIIHNVTEVFIYGGLAAIFVPYLNLYAAFFLLIAISIYDMIAVWKSKHMIKMAKFQTSSRVFAGLSIPYTKAPAKVKAQTKASKTAILGGGDIGFPLLFAGVVMKGLLLGAPIMGFVKALMIPVCATIALLILLLKSKEDKFYPAMPFLSIGVFVGYLLVLLV